MSETGLNRAGRVLGVRQETLLVFAGLMGITVAAMPACGSDSGSTDTGQSGSSATAQAGNAGNAPSQAGTGGESGSAEAPSCSASSSTAANTSEVVDAANALNALLTSDQKTAIALDATLAHAQQWSNLPTTAIPRNGVMIGDMSADAQAAALALVAVAAGSTGSTLFSELRAADEWLVTDGKAQSDSYGEGRYYFAFIGTPSKTSTWMLQVAGHHLAYNFTYNGACTSATPLFDGVEPTSWTDSDQVTHSPLETQRASSVAVIAAIADDPDSLLAGTFTDVVNGPSNSNGLGDSRYPTGITYPTGSTGRGVLVGGLSDDARALVKTAIEAWVKNVADPVANALLDEYESDAALAQTYVAYSGAKDLTTKNSYFRIDGPRVWIEYTIQGGIVYQSKVHFHTLWRDKASDYGAEYVNEPATDPTAGTGGATGMGGPPFGNGGGNGPGGPPSGDAGSN